MAAEHDRHPPRPDAGEAAEPDCPGAVLPGTVFTAGSGWFDQEGRPHVVRIELPLSAREMVAALYGEHDRLTPADLGTEEEVWGHIAMVVVQDGLPAVWQLARLIDAQEPCHALAAPGWLTLCRKRIAEVSTGKPGAPPA